MTDNLDFYMNSEKGRMNLESQQCGFGEFEQEISQLTEKNEHSSSMETTNENVESNLIMDTNFNVFQLFRFLGNWPSSSHLNVSDDKEEGLSEYSNISNISRSKSNDNESNFIKPNIRECMEKLTSILHEQGEVQIFTSMMTSSKGEYRAVNNVRNRDYVFYTDACLPKLFEEGILCHKNIHINSGNIEKLGIAQEQRDYDMQILNEGPKNQISSGVASQVSKNMNSDFFQSEELFAPVDANNALIAPSSTDVQRHLNDKRYVCTECGKDFLRKHQLVSHYRTHTGEKPFACEKCGKSFSKSNNLKVHRRIHCEQKPFACDKCSKRFSELSQLASHRRIHTEKNPFACDMCWKRFRRSDHLAMHRRFHTGEKPFACEECGKRFSLAHDMVKHRRIHTGEKPFSCEKCGKSFSQSNNLNVHRRIHSEQKPFACDKCSKRFSELSQLALHRRIHTEENPFVCDKCEKRFSKSNGLSRHRRTHTTDNYF